MPTRSTFEAQLASLSTCSPENFEAASVQFLSACFDTPDSLADYLESIPTERLCSLVNSCHVLNVQPRVFLIYSDPLDRFQVTINYFERIAFNRLLLEGKVTPHNHVRSFSTVIMLGGYTHWLYKNVEGECEVNLRLAAKAKCEVGSIYSLPAEKYHVVLAPEDSTLTLNVRGRRELEAPALEPGEAYDATAIMHWRRKILECLSQAHREKERRLLAFR